MKQLLGLCNIPNFQFGMLYIGHSCISYFIAFSFAILEILSNSRTLGESWGLHCFHIWILSNIETRITLALIIFLFENISYQNIWEEIIWLLQNKWNIRGNFLKSNKLFYLGFIAILFELGKIRVSQNCILGPRKCSSCSRYFI